MDQLLDSKIRLNTSHNSTLHITEGLHRCLFIRPSHKVNTNTQIRVCMKPMSCRNKDTYTSSLLHILEPNRQITFTGVEHRSIIMSWFQIRKVYGLLLSTTGYTNRDRTVAVGMELLPV